MPEITPLDDRILEAFDPEVGMRAGLRAVYELGVADARERLQHEHTVNVMRSDYDRLQARALELATNFPCDGGCNTNDGPAEDCSLHGRSPRDLWSRLEVAARRLNEIRRYAEERKAYGTRGRTVHSSRIASDLLQILDREVTTDGSRG